MRTSSPAPLLPPVVRHLQQGSPTASSPVSGGLISEPPMSLSRYPPHPFPSGCRSATKTDVLEDIPVFVYGDGRSPAEADAKESCAICLDNFEAGGEVGMMPRCGHMFHPPCIKKWWLFADCKTCPLCRAVVIAVTEA
ncbi:hypothetical protein OPV22_000530 [Ensete ventricosum]|uniref:RING-type domain-containing protein n=1 Tax=Ensete ventricosum TaxID=4639 RepID=A0AAV8Q9L5_ENSVE|nr:hypothetical protein OPV22_000530 [Ensete ventricosum]